MSNEPTVQMSDPASPMQISYSPAQPPMQLSTSTDVYADNGKLPYPQLTHYSQPPPNYSEAVGIAPIVGEFEQIQPDSGFFSLPEFTAQ